MIETQGVDLFLEDLRNQCKQHKIKLTFSNYNNVSLGGGMKASGYFDSYSKVLSVAKNRVDWLSVLVHESCHLDQWIENKKNKSENIWSRSEVEGENILEDYIQGKRKRAKIALKNIILVELDCEKRSVQKIMEYELPINVHQYIRKANAYLLNYHRYYESKQWKNEEWPLTLVSGMPDKFRKDAFYLNLSKKMRKIFIDNGF
jgi:hypothetical protein